MEGILDGLYTEMDNKGNVIKEIIYTNGLIVLEAHTLRTNKSVIKFQKKNGKLDGKWIETYKNEILLK